MDDFGFYRVKYYGNPAFAGLLAQQLEQAGCTVVDRDVAAEKRHDPSMGEIVAAAATGGAVGASAQLLVKGSVQVIRRVVEAFRAKRNNVPIEVEEDEREEGSEGYM